MQETAPEDQQDQGGQGDELEIILDTHRKTGGDFIFSITMTPILT